jgi:hypothetical protein
MQKGEVLESPVLAFLLTYSEIGYHATL